MPGTDREREENRMTSLTRIGLVLCVSTLALAPWRAALAQGTPDDVTPAVEDACTGMVGAAFGLCVAFCEANDCDVYPDSQACDTLRANYTKITGELAFPCELSEPPSDPSQDH